MNRSLPTSKITPLSKLRPRSVSCLGNYPWCVTVLSLFVAIVLLDNPLTLPAERHLSCFAGEVAFQTP